MQCPKCGSGVPDGSTQCHICFAPIDPSARSGPIGLQAPTLREAPPDDDVVPGIPGIDRHRQPAGDAEPVPNYLNPNAEPVPNYMNPGAGAGLGAPLGGGGVRVSLTGEVLEAPAPAPQAGPAPYSRPGARPSGAPSGPLPSTYSPGGVRPPAGAPGSGPVPPARGPYAGPVRNEAPARRGAGAGIAVAIVVVLLLVGGAAGGWWWWNNRTNPKDQALAVYQALVKQQWKPAFYLIAWQDSVTLDDATAEGFASGADKGFNSTLGRLPAQQAQMVRQALSTMQLSVGEPVTTGDRADVPTTGNLTISGITITMSGTAHMIRSRGTWKLDATTASPTDQVALSKVFQDLVGKPAGMGALGGAFRRR